MGVMTRLQAVNRMLTRAGEQPVESLTSDPTNESLMAENVLDEVNIQEQMAGLHVNTIVVQLDPDPTTSEIVLPDTLLSVLPWWDEAGKFESGDDMPDSRDRDLVQRGFNPIRLFDRDRNSFEFDDSVTVKYTLLMDFEELPAAQQFRVADRAARIYEAMVQNDPNISNMLAAEASLSRAMGRAEDMRARRQNAFTTAQNTLARRMNRVRRDWF